MKSRLLFGMDHLLFRKQADDIIDLSSQIGRQLAVRDGRPASWALRLLCLYPFADLVCESRKKSLLPLGLSNHGGRHARTMVLGDLPFELFEVARHLGFRLAQGGNAKLGVLRKKLLYFLNLN